MENKEPVDNIFCAYVL